MESRLVWHQQRNRMSPFDFVHNAAGDTSLTAHIWLYSLKTKGLNVSHTGISVKTSKRFDHEEYMEATRRCVFSHLDLTSHLLISSYFSTSLRGLVKAVGASSFGKAENPTIVSQHGAPTMERVSSDSSSITSQEKKKKKGIFRSRKWSIAASPSAHIKIWAIFARNNEIICKIAWL